MSYPPRFIPENLYNEFTLNNQIPVVDYFFPDGVSISNANWTPELIKKYIDTYTLHNVLTNNKVYDYSSDEHCRYHNGAIFNLIAMMKYKSHIVNKNVAVIGSFRPWLEAMIINMGAKSVTTVEYNKPTSTDLIKTVSYDEFTNSTDKYDAIFSYSSIEHSGLGRYGDPLNPNGDLETMKNIRQHLANDGLVFIGVPIGKEMICWNAHRIYGRIRLRLLFDGFQDIEWIGAQKDYIDIAPHDIGGGNQPVIVLKKSIVL